MKNRGLFSIVLAGLGLVLVFGWLIGGGKTAVHAAAFTVNSTTDAVDANPGDGACAASSGDCTLRAAIQETNALTSDDVITLPAGTYALSIAGEDEDDAATGDLDIQDNLVINGSSANNTIVDGNALDRVFDIRNANNVTFSNLTVQNGRANDTSIFQSGGGAIRGSSTNLLLDSVILKNNTAVNGNKGGAVIMLSASTLHMVNSILSGNTAAGFGGAIGYDFGNASTTAALIIENSTLSDNNSGRFGGAISFAIGDSNDSVSLKNVQLINNSANQSGGALHLDGDGSQIEIIDTLFRQNSTDSAGAAIVNFGDDISLDIINTNFISNTAVSWGGAMYMTGLTNTLSIADSTFSYNESNSNGGAIALYGPGPTFDIVGVTAVISNSSFTENNAVSGGGALYQGVGTDISVTHSAFISNTANNGGAIHSSSDGMTGAAEGYFTNSTFSGNRAAGSGGAIYGYTLSTDLRFRNVTIAFNTADSDNNGVGDGGGVALNNNPYFGFINSLIANNSDFGNEAPDCSAPGGFGSVANNLVGKTDGCTFTPGPDDLVGSIATPLDPMLQPLTGTPAHHPLYIDSPAIDAGFPGPPVDNPNTVNCPTTDQAGSTRPIDGNGDGNNICDIGAIEAPTRITHLVDPAISSTLTYTDTQSNPTVIDIPVGAVTETTTLFFMPQAVVTPTANMSFANHAFTLNAYRDDILLSGFTFEHPITVTIHYSDDDIAGMSEASLSLLYWAGTQWSSDGIFIIERDLTNNKLVVTIEHLSEFAVFGESHQVYLPVVTK